MISKNNENIDSYRYERKFFLKNLIREELEFLVKTLPTGFSEIFKKRQVNNIYFDTFNFDSYTDNIDGSPFRKKIRIRWYGILENEIKNPVLEIKQKKGLVGRKLSYALPSFKLEKIRSKNFFLSLKKDSDIPEHIWSILKVLNLSILNTYHRTYFLSKSTKIRITVDDNLFFYNQLSRRINIDNYIEQKGSILEIKYPRSSNYIVNRITSKFPFRLTKSSKYVSGFNIIHHIPD